MIERGGAGSEQASGDHGEIGIAGSEPHEDERPLFVQADEKLARTGGDDLGGDFGGTQAEGFGHVGAAEELDQEAPAAGFQVGGLGSQHQPLRFLGRLSQRRGPQAVVAGGDDASPRRAREGANALGNLRGDGVGVKQHLEEGIRGDEVAQQRRRAGELPALREIEEGLLGRLVLDPFGHAFAQPDPGGKTRQFGTPEARYQDRLTSLEAFDERFGQKVHGHSLRAIGSKVEWQRTRRETTQLGNHKLHSSQTTCGREQGKGRKLYPIVALAYT